MDHKSLFPRLVLAILYFLTACQRPAAAAPPANRGGPAPVYLPIVQRPGCFGNAIANGDFEQGSEGWSQSTTGMGNKFHHLIGSLAEGFHPYTGEYAAGLGGYEGVWDAITQTVTIPTSGQLSYWWQLGTYETTVFQDSFAVMLLEQDGEEVASLAAHSISEPAGAWRQDRIDLSPYAGRTLVVQFSAYNDNYYFSWFDLDRICLRGPGDPE